MTDIIVIVLLVLIWLDNSVTGENIRRNIKNSTAAIRHYINRKVVKK